jgi:pimeloyl-ACP methyl ester carboxylesterase
MNMLLLKDLDALLAYQDFPVEEPARVYLHGLGSSAIADFPVIATSPALGQQRAILVDLLGHGFSERPAAFDYSLESHALTVATLLDDLSLAACDIVGHSLGGSIAIVLADIRPDLIARLVIVEGNLEPGPQEGSNASGSRSIAVQPEAAYVGGGFASKVRMFRVVAPTYGAVMQHADPLALHRTSVSLVSAARPTLRERLLSLTIPKVYVFGGLTLQNNADMVARAEELPDRAYLCWLCPVWGMTWDSQAGTLVPSQVSCSKP